MFSSRYLIFYWHEYLEIYRRMLVYVKTIKLKIRSTQKSGQKFKQKINLKKSIKIITNRKWNKFNCKHYIKFLTVNIPQALIKMFDWKMSCLDIDIWT